MVIGLLVTAGLGALAFKLGMDAQKMSHDGKSAGDIASAMPKDAVDTVKDAAGSCCGAFSSMFCCGGSAPVEPEGEDQDTDGAEVDQSSEEPKNP